MLLAKLRSLFGKSAEAATDDDMAEVCDCEADYDCDVDEAEAGGNGLTEPDPEILAGLRALQSQIGDLRKRSRADVESKAEAGGGMTTVL